MSSFEFSFNGGVATSTLEREGEFLKVTVGDRRLVLTPAGENLFTTVIEGRKAYVAVTRHKGVYYIDVDSVLLEVTEPSSDEEFGGVGGAVGEKDKVFAPMPGKIVKVMVQVGDEVTEKQQMVIVEAMKMENVVTSKAAGKVKAVNFAAGDQVDTETPIIELELAAE